MSEEDYSSSNLIVFIILYLSFFIIIIPVPIIVSQFTKNITIIISSLFIAIGITITIIVIVKIGYKKHDEKFVRKFPANNMIILKNSIFIQSIYVLIVKMN